MGAATAEKVREIEAVREQLGAHIHELEDLLPEAKARAMRLLFVGASIFGGLMVLMTLVRLMRRRHDD